MAKETQMQRTEFRTLWEKARVGWFERIALKYAYYHMWNRSPVQVWCLKQGTQGWWTGTTLSDRMGREVGGGFRMGDTCTPMADSCQWNIEKSQDVRTGWKLRRHTKRGAEPGLQRNLKGRVGWGEEKQAQSRQSTPHSSLWEKS